MLSIVRAYDSCGSYLYWLASVLIFEINDFIILSPFTCSIFGSGVLVSELYPPQEAKIILDKTPDTSLSMCFPLLTFKV